jgi:hypothetical protein
MWSLEHKFPDFRWKWVQLQLERHWRPL